MRRLILFIVLLPRLASPQSLSAGPVVIDVPPTKITIPVWRRSYRPALSLTCSHPSHRPCPGRWGKRVTGDAGRYQLLTGLADPPWMKPVASW